MISVRDLAKHYQVHKRPPGLAAALRSVVRRRYETVKAVDGISFEIAAGERVGFLGPNGAGKTTTLKMLSGLLHPTAGRALVAGHEPGRREADFLRSIMLVTGQKQQLLWDLPPAETFELNRAIYDVPRARFRETLDELVELLQLGDLVGKPTRQLSLGERMKCELAAALLHRPRVLFLDEPTIGLDVTMQAVVRDFIKAYNERHGATVILTSHYMDDVAALCPRVIVIDHGRLTWDGALEELARQTRPEKRITLRLGREVTAAELERIGGRVVLRDGSQAILGVPAGQLRDVVAAALAELPVIDLNVEEAPLEEVLSELFARGRRA
ncbi:ATP-binding cassette domain-containing protein [Vulgatibacter sp.]|uniref:ABC transporter ATP-binding protein n=1 Tax=Vulgatibacter sp. TaxID=1971226 RepID=UPI003569D78B